MKYFLKVKYFFLFEKESRFVKYNVRKTNLGFEQTDLHLIRYKKNSVQMNYYLYDSKAFWKGLAKKLCRDKLAAIEIPH